MFRTHNYLQTARNFETNPMGPVPGSETQISRKKSLNFLIGVRIFLGMCFAHTFVLTDARRLGHLPYTIRAWADF